MSRKWLRESSKDLWYRKAKREGYRTRASFKLLQIQEKFNLMKEGDRIVDLGAAPGGWAQVARKIVGEEGVVVGVDLAPIDPMEGVTFLRGDMTKPDTVARTLEAVGGVADVVISDMSPSISGAYSTDQARSVWLSEHALDFAGKVLRRGGRFTCKVFEGELFPGYLRRVRGQFQRVKVTSPRASRSASSEVYVIGLGFTGPAGYAQGADAVWSEGDGLPPSRRRGEAAAEAEADPPTE